MNMSKLRLYLSNGKRVEVEAGTSIANIIEKYYEPQELPVMLGKLNNRYLELDKKIVESGTFQIVHNDNEIGMRTYGGTVSFLFIKAALDIFPEGKIILEHSISKGIFGEIEKESPLTEEDVLKVKNRMIELINKKIKINKKKVTKEEAIEIFENYGMIDKVRLLKYLNREVVNLYELDGRYDYFYGFMASNIGEVKVFDVIYYNNGFMLRYPSEKNPMIIEEFKEQKKLAQIFYESKKWLKILGVGEIGFLNDRIEEDETKDIIKIAEALHEKKIANIADMISSKKEVKIVLIAGPSSSGKTTFSKRLGIQLRVNGLNPIPISLDDYFVNRENTPLDEEGEPDFESIYALDLKLFNEHLKTLLEGGSVELPSYNFITGKREWSGKSINLIDNGVLIIEGIHGLNDKLTASIEKENKFKIYISALTQLNIDNHNRIATTDVRKIRRIVRDFLTRGYKAEDTLAMWKSIKRGEEKNIFVFQENVDVMFNSTLVYELCVLKKYALEELEKISKESKVYYEAERLKGFIKLFKDIEVEEVPQNSLLREFIGGSCFYKY